MKPILLRARQFSHEIILALILLAFFIGARRADPSFVTVATQQGLYSHIWDLALLALPMTLIIITGGIDLSIGSTMALASVTLGMTYATGVPMSIAILAALMVGAFCGLLNGLLIAKLRVHALIVTLATFSAYRGIAEGISLPKIYSGFPPSFTAWGQQAVLQSPGKDAQLYHLHAAGWLFIVSAITVAVVLWKTPFGRSLFAMGHNETATRFSGIRVDRIKLILYTLSGLTAAVVAINYSALRDTAQAAVGQQMELDVITAVVLGGCSIFGGRGTILGTILGVLLIHETREFVAWHWNKSEYVPVVIGSLLIFSVAINALLGRKSAG